jgi:hypothetical protein
MLEPWALDAVELSALRDFELPSLVEFVNRADLNRFSHISVHAPSSYARDQEPWVVENLVSFVDRKWPIIVHPDVIYDFGLWRKMGHWLYIENMDKRKSTGRTVEELHRIFERLPDARMCFDIAHARQFDTSMNEAYRIVKSLSAKFGQIHISEVGTSSRHDIISPMAVRAYREVASAIPGEIPAILETPVRPDQIADQLRNAAMSLDPVLIE